MNRHTPGPWRAERTETVRGNPAWLIDSATVHGLALLEFMRAEDRDGFGTANAALMAAAPELLAALEDALACIDGIPEADRARLGLYSMRWYGEARAAIAKVREVRP